MAVTRVAALREGLLSGGYTAADQVEVVSHSSEGEPTRLTALAADLVQRKVDVLVPVSPSAVRAAKAATATIPILANDLESDPVASGFVASLARPGGNITGLPGYNAAQVILADLGLKADWAPPSMAERLSAL